MITGNVRLSPFLFHFIVAVNILVPRTTLSATFITDLWYQSFERSFLIQSTIGCFTTSPTNCDGSPHTRRRMFKSTESSSLLTLLSKPIKSCKTLRLSPDAICPKSSLHSCSGRIQHNCRPSVTQSFGHSTFVSAMSPSTIVVGQPIISAHMSPIFKPSVHHIVGNASHLTNTTSQLPDDFKDFATRYARDKCPSDAFFAHCHCELFHEQWKVLLDGDFLNAYEHGIVITCCDGIKRRFYPRIFTYSADYPEKRVVKFC